MTRRDKTPSTPSTRTPNDADARLIDLLAEDLSTLPATLRGWVDKVREAADELIDVERTQRDSVYEVLAELLGREIDQEPAACQAWIVWHAEPDSPISRRDFDAMRAVDDALGGRKVLLRGKFTCGPDKRYSRRLQVYLADRSGQFRVLEAEHVLGLDDLPADVQHAFLVERQERVEFAIL